MNNTCSECKKECNSACPYCKALVHPFYGFMNMACGAQHEQKCADAREANPPRKA